MQKALYVVGVIALIWGVVIGVAIEALFGSMFYITWGIMNLVLFFCLARVLNNQETILQMLHSQKKETEITPDKITCTWCKKEYDNDASSCPHCMHRSEPLKKSSIQDAE